MLWGSTARTGVQSAKGVTKRIVIVSRFGWVEHVGRASDWRNPADRGEAQTCCSAIASLASVTTPPFEVRPATNHNPVDDTPMAQTAAQDSRMHISSEQHRPALRSLEVVGTRRPALGQ
jgi:hypothetical protein